MNPIISIPSSPPHHHIKIPISYKEGKPQNLKASKSKTQKSKNSRPPPKFSNQKIQLPLSPLKTSHEMCPSINPPKRKESHQRGTKEEEKKEGKKDTCL
ncbi:hypothetical protein EYC80_003769 [Monilinia laxa]|uniref:Uncharacterized protein n=1 Tax=Monilinia laxa TaxID=61186 RepID=A0A5N6KL76_MONLA|nr:hypothetical protein EYC80_003769 [Monilinia laxa]